MAFGLCPAIKSQQEVVYQMSSLSMRRLIPVCVVVVAALAAAIAPGSASATTDLGEQCSGANPIKGRGSSFQNTLLQKWVVDFNEIGGVPNANPLACGGSQGSGGKPKVEYLSGGSGACLHAWGTEKVETPKFKETAYCGTDEAPNATQKSEMESFKTGGETRSIETIPVAQGAVAVVVHLPEHCKAESEIEVNGKKVKLGRLVFENSTVEGVYAGTIRTWKQLLADQTTGSDKLICRGNTESKEGEEGLDLIKFINEKGKEITVPSGTRATAAQEEEEVIHATVRLDHSGTTHIFKSYIEQINTSPIEMEAYPEEIGSKKTGCGAAKPEESEKWDEVAEACQNQRWPAAAKVVRGTIVGNPGVEARVNQVQSSIGYGDLGSVRESGFFSKKGVGGENVKGTETTVGEKHTEFWAEVQDTATPATSGYAEPATNGDIEKSARSNCDDTVYTNEAGKAFPPANTRELWNGAKAELTEKKYAICGLTYDLLLRQYAFYPELGVESEGKPIATAAHDFLLWAVNNKEEGGSNTTFFNTSDYEALPTVLRTKAEKGIEEVGWKKA